MEEMDSKNKLQTPLYIISNIKKYLSNEQNNPFLDLF